ncbi:MAG: UvrB/UvrC motif-containing protein [Candidatus Omnitrophica bacterium]|nr:UvrB/UvrC motif-containing protein [Candidatus Omnitrophota bacterium]
MLCNLCGKNDASIHLTEIVNGKAIELHLCESCAQEKGAEFSHQFSFGDLLAGLADLAPITMSEAVRLEKCSTCGQSIAELSKSGRLGCPDCYKNLQRSLLPIIKRVQRSTQHVGKRPQKVSAKVKRQITVRELEEKLKKFIAQEDYEKAAEVRDEIRKLAAEKSRTSENSSKESGTKEKK